MAQRVQLSRLASGLSRGRSSDPHPGAGRLWGRLESETGRCAPVSTHGIESGHAGRSGL